MSQTIGFSLYPETFFKAALTYFERSTPLALATFSRCSLSPGSAPKSTVSLGRSFRIGQIYKRFSNHITSNCQTGLRNLSYTITCKFMSNYLELLKDPRWQKKRLEIFERDEWKCTECNKGDKQLHVHHKQYVYGKNPWDYDNSYLVTMCEKCHLFEEQLKKDEAVDMLSKSCGLTRVTIWLNLSLFCHWAKNDPEQWAVFSKQIAEYMSLETNRKKYVQFATKELTDGKEVH